MSITPKSPDQQPGDDQNMGQFSVKTSAPRGSDLGGIQQREQIAFYPGVETGGLMLGSCSARTMVITVVDLLDAPSDSTRSASLFVLGKAGLKHAITKRYEDSGKRLIDVGTWHSHLTETGPSTIDRNTAKDLAHERPPPAVLLIATPSSFHALMHEPASA